MRLSWQQGPLAPGAIGRFLVPEPLPRLLYAEPLRRACVSGLAAPSSPTARTSCCCTSRAAAGPYHRIDIRQTSRHLVVRSGERAGTGRGPDR